MRFDIKPIALLLAAGWLSITAQTAPGAQTLFVGTHLNQTIEKIDSAGSGSTFATNHDLFSYTPLGMAFDNEGNLYSNLGPNIYKYAPDGSRTLFANTGSQIAQGLAIDQSDNLYAALNSTTTQSNSSIAKFTPAGVGSVFAAYPTDSLNNLRGLVFNAAGILYAADQSANTIEAFTHAGVGTVFADSTSGLHEPGGLAFDSQGNLYATSDSGFIKKFTAPGVGSTFANISTGPAGLAIDDADNVYVAETFNNQIVKFTPAAISSVFTTGLQSPGYLAFQVPEPPPWLLVTIVIAAYLFRRRSREDRS